MIPIPGYEVIEQIYESGNTFIFRGKKDENDGSVILKMLKNDYRIQGEQNRYQIEYEITKNLNLERVVSARRLLTKNNTLILIFDEFKSTSLNQFITEHSFSLEKALSLALLTAEALCDIHNTQIIHKNINPSNILVSKDTNELKIIDFGIATGLPQQLALTEPPNFIEGNLGYVSPEQTGRMNRPIDFRSDLYSFGATLYELFTGKRPFQSQDTMELVHCHIAKQPLSPNQVNPTIPSVLADMIMRLMAKNPEDRYQGAWGIAADLNQCLILLCQITPTPVEPSWHGIPLPSVVADAAY